MRTVADIEAESKKTISEVFVEIKYGIPGFKKFCEWVIGRADNKPLILQNYQLEWANAFLHRPRSCVMAHCG